MSITAAVLVGLLALGAVLTAALGVYAYRHREEPGADAFVVLMGILTNWSVVYAVGLLTRNEMWRIVWLRMVWLSTGTIEVWLLLFALAYTGHDTFVTRKSVAALHVVPAIVIAATWTNPWHNLFWVEHAIVSVDGLVLVNPTWGPLFWAEVIYTYLLVAVASALLIRLVYQSDYLYTDQSGLLLLGIAVPFVASAADVFVLADQPAIDPTPYAFTVTGIAFGYALFRRQLFDLVPATRQLGRNMAIGQLDAGIVIVDNGNRIVYCNAAGEAVLDCEATEAIGRDVELLVDQSRLDFDTEDALVELDDGDRTYEIRTSPITDRRDQRIGNTLVIHDVTARKQRERQLASQRDELSTVNELNAVIRGVNQALVSALDRGEIERAVCDRVADADLYQRVCTADLATWVGDADRWTVAGSDSAPGPPAVTADLDTDGSAPESIVLEDGNGGIWTVVPLRHGRTVYGALGLYTERESVGERERTVLGELGELIGNAINAVETRQLLSADSVVDLSLESTDDVDPLVAATADLAGRLEMKGLVPAGKAEPVAYLKAVDVSVTAARDALAAATEGPVRTIRDDGGGGVIEWQVAGVSPLETLVDHGASVTDVRADGGRVQYDVVTASATDLRALLDTLQRPFEGIEVRSKRERARADDAVAELPGESLGDLTDRQCQALEAAYRAGYFNWPRDSTAEEVAETLDISSSTLHSHLRKAEGSLLADIFEAAESDPVAGE